MDFDDAKIAFHIMLCHWCVDWKLEILNCHKDSTKIVKNPSLSQVFHHFTAWHAQIIPSIKKVTFDKNLSYLQSVHFYCGLWSLSIIESTEFGTSTEKQV